MLLTTLLSPKNPNIVYSNNAADMNPKLLITLLLCMLLGGIGATAQAQTSIDETRKKAEAGDVEAQMKMATTYYYGYGMEANQAEGAKWYQMAAEQGHLKAIYILGELYYYGSGVEQDVTKAIEWWRKGAAKGDERCKYMLKEAGAE